MCVDFSISISESLRHSLNKKQKIIKIIKKEKKDSDVQESHLTVVIYSIFKNSGKDKK